MPQKCVFHIFFYRFFSFCFATFYFPAQAQIVGGVALGALLDYSSCRAHRCRALSPPAIAYGVCRA